MHAPRPDQPADESADRTSDAVSGSSFTRRAFTGGVVAAAGLSLIGGWPSAAKAEAHLANSSNRNRDTRAFGSVAGSPHLSRDFTRTFQSHIIHADGIRAGGLDRQLELRLGRVIGVEEPLPSKSLNDGCRPAPKVATACSVRVAGVIGRSTNALGASQPSAASFHAGTPTGPGGGTTALLTDA